VTEPSPFVRFLVRTTKAIRAAGLKPAPPEPAKDGVPAPQKTGSDWEGLGRDLGRAFRKFKDGDRPKS
jgi:hypothetical protein